jgi:hypothetical protein
MIFKNLRTYVFQFLYFFDKKAGKKLNGLKKKKKKKKFH